MRPGGGLEAMLLDGGGAERVRKALDCSEGVAAGLCSAGDCCEFLLRAIGLGAISGGGCLEREDLSESEAADHKFWVGDLTDGELRGIMTSAGAIVVGLSTEGGFWTTFEPTGSD